MAPPLFKPQIGERHAPVEIDLKGIPWQTGLLIRSTNWLGDVIMSLPGMYRLTTVLPPGVPRLVLCPKNLAPLWDAVPWASEVISFTGRRLDAEVSQQLKTRRPEVSVILPNSFGSAWDLWRAGLPHRIGRSGRGRTMLLDHKLPEYVRQPGRDLFHEARLYLEFAACCGAPEWTCGCPPLQVTVDKRTAGELAVDLQDLLVIAPSAAYGPAKQWPVARFNEVAAWWSREIGPVVAVGTAAETEVADQAVKGVAGARNLAGKTSLRELLYVLSRARCVVANDSGAMHLAAALGRDGVAIFGSTDPLVTGPIGGRWVVLQDRLECAPCLKRKCKRKETPYECLLRIRTEAVQEALRSLLNQ